LVDAAWLFAPKKPPKIPNYEAITLSPTAGWLLLGAVVCLLGFFLVHREAWRRLWLRVDDPRTVAIVRILFVACTLANVNGLWELWEYLFTDEGVFSTDVAQHVRARRQFAGYGDGLTPGEPVGFYDFQAFLEWLKGPNYSLLLFDSSPVFFYVHLIAFEITMLMFLVGWQTKWVKWVALFLFHSIILRNTLYWEGTENVYRSFLFYLCLARCGHAFSVDNWLRCRKLRRQGRLSERTDPERGGGRAPDEEHPQGLAPIYRAIPGWPRLLMMMQIAVLYLNAGCTKNGPTWIRGDSFYYALNLDHFYRYPPQTLSYYFGTNFMRLSAHIAHYWQAFFPLVLIGLVLRWHLREKLPPLSRRALRTGRALLLGFAVFFVGLIVWTYPVHYRQAPDVPSLATVQWMVGVGSVLGVAGLWWLYKRLRYLPFKVRLRGHEFRIDLEWVCAWLFGRRVWLLVGSIFHVHLIIMLNVGWFNPGLFVTYVAFLNGPELVNLLRWVGRRLKRRNLPVPRTIKRGEPAARAENPTLPHLHRDGHVFPLTASLSILAIAILGVLRDVATQPNLWAAVEKVLAKKKVLELPEALTSQVQHVGWGWFGVAIGVFALTLTLRTRRGRAYDPMTGVVVLATCFAASLLHEYGLLGFSWALPVVAIVTFAGTRKRAKQPQPLPLMDPLSGRARTPWAYAPVGRLLASSVVLLHIFALGIWLLPDKWCLSTFRPEARKPITWWVQTTQTTQSWSMFAPNPPRANMFLRVLIVDQNDDVYDVQADTYACFDDPTACDSVYPMPWVTYTRQRKINRRVAGAEGGNGIWAQKWHARYYCRWWALNNGGEAPKRVELYKVTYPIPSPQWVADNGPYDPAERYRKLNKQTKLHTVRCKSDIGGQLPNYMRQRHGLPEVDESEVRRWHKKRCQRWERKLRDEARARGEEVTDDDPRFKRCEE
jgi:hypothetical protein